MPEFILNGKDAPEFQKLDEFTQGYIEALFFTEEERLCEEAGRTLPGFDDLAPETLLRLIRESRKFQEENALDLNRAYKEYDYEPEQAGRDFWFSRNGHGVGFWDRGLGAIGDKLHDAAKHKEINPYIGDDGLIYLD